MNFKRRASTEALTALDLIHALQIELAGTRRLAVAALGIAAASLGAVTLCLTH